MPTLGSLDMKDEWCNKAIPEVLVRRGYGGAEPRCLESGMKDTWETD